MSILLAAIEKKFGSEYRLSSDGAHAVFTHQGCGPKRDRLYVNVDTGGYFCQQCEENGWVNVDGWEPTGAKGRKTLRPFDWYQPIDIDTDKRAIKYLWSRGIRRDQWESYGMQLSGLDLYRGLILVPIYTAGEYQGWQGRNYFTPDEIRSLTQNRKDEDPKYHPLIVRNPENRWFSCSGFHRATAIFNYDEAVNSDLIVLCEGIFSCTAVLNHNFKAIATLGKSISEAQLKLLFKLVSVRGEVTIAIDGDALFTAMLLGYRFSEVGIRTRIVHFENDRVINGVEYPSEDPASVSDIEHRIRTARLWTMNEFIEVMHLAKKIPSKIKRNFK
jgi:hypothetical protein